MKCQFRNAIQDLKERMLTEGLDNCIDGIACVDGMVVSHPSYSTWQDIENEGFHELRLKYLAAKRQLEDWIERHE